MAIRVNLSGLVDDLVKLLRAWSHEAMALRAMPCRGSKRWEVTTPGLSTAGAINWIQHGSIIMISENQWLPMMV